MTTTAEWRKWNALNTKPITNADRIRSMTDEELAAFIADDLCELLCGAPLACDGQCKQKMLDWLREVATDGEQD